MKEGTRYCDSVLSVYLCFHPGYCEYHMHAAAAAVVAEVLQTRVQGLTKRKADREQIWARKRAEYLLRWRLAQLVVDVAGL